MSGFISNLREKPEKTKHKIALLASLVLTLIILGIYILMKIEKPEMKAASSTTGEDLKPLFLIFKRAKTDFKDIKSGAENYKNPEVNNSNVVK